MTLSHAQKRVREPNVLGPLMVKMGDADAFVSGLTYEYPDVIRPALQIHHAQGGGAGCRRVHHDRWRTASSCSPTPRSTSIQLPRIWPRSPALQPISPSGSRSSRVWPSSPSPTLAQPPTLISDKVRKAVELLKKDRPDLKVDGEMQADTAVVPEIVEERYPFSAVKDANVLVFPSLESANIAYKLLARLGNAQAIGPILLGIGAPVHVLQTGDEVDSIVQMAAVAVMDAMSRK